MDFFDAPHSVQLPKTGTRAKDRLEQDDAVAPSFFRLIFSAESTVREISTTVQKKTIQNGVRVPL